MTELPRLSRQMASRSTTSSNPVRRMFTAVTPPPQAVARLEDLLEPAGSGGPSSAGRSHPAGIDLRRYMARIDAATPGWTSCDKPRRCHCPIRAGPGRRRRIPGPRLAKALWLGPTIQAANSLPWPAAAARAARRAGISVPMNRVGHLTIARYRHPADARPQIDALDATTIEPWPVTEIVLIESLLGQGDDEACVMSCAKDTRCRATECPTRTQIMKPSAWSCSRPSSVIRSIDHGGIHQLMVTLRARLAEHRLGFPLDLIGSVGRPGWSASSQA